MATNKFSGSVSAVPAVIRLVFLCLFLYTTVSVSVSWASLATLLLLVASIYLLDNSCTEPPSDPLATNPLKGKPRTTELPVDREIQVSQAVSDFVSYDAENCMALDKFAVVKMGTECIFARKAKVWGSRDWDDGLTLEENVYRSTPMLLKFCLVCEELGLDGFLFLLPGNQFGADPHVFGQGVRRVLQTLSDLDPAKVRCMDKSYVAKRGWVFEFNHITFFITTFAPFYPESHSRYNFGADDCFILFQPELSFAQHDLSEDTPVTNWDYPVTVRDRIRTAFRAAGREYLIRDTVVYPMAHDIVKPLRNEDAVTEWWKKE